MLNSTIQYTIEVIDMKSCLSNPTIMGYLRGMTLDEFSGMSIMLDEFMHGRYARDAKAIIAFIDNLPIAWALYTLEPDEYGDILFNENAEAYFQLFVRPECRRRGIGSVLFLKGQELAAGKKIGVSAHDVNARAFFSKVQGVLHERN